MTRYRVGGERGSVLLCALVLLFVLTIMGVALFDTALIDAQLAQHSVDDSRALESAQAGLQRALYRLYLDLCGTPTCANPSVDARWDDGDIAGQAVAVSTGAFAAFIGTAASFSGPFQDPRGAGFPEELHAGAYSVRIKHVTKGEAKMLGVACLDGGAADSQVCPHVVYLRSTGTFGRPADVPTSVRVVQVLVRASSETFAAGNMALFGEKVTGTGSPEVHGSVRLLPCASPPCTLTLSSGIGIRNNYNGLDGLLQSIIPLLPVVQCPGGTPCAGMDVETLDGSVRIRKADADGSAAVNIQWAEASVGQASVASNSATGNLGKPTMDRVDLGRGCAPQGISPPCSDVVGGNPANVYVDRPIRSDDRGPIPRFPQLSDPTAIRGASYSRYAACDSFVPGSTPTCDVGSTSDFFIAHAFKIVPGAPPAGSPEDPRPPGECDAPGPLQKRVGPGGGHDCVVRSVFDILSGATAWDTDTATFRYTMKCAPLGSTECGSGPSRVNGWTPGFAEPAVFMIEWRGIDWATYTDDTTLNPPNVLAIYQCGNDATCASPAPFNLNAPTIPVMIYVDGNLRICPGCAGTRYQGHGMFLAQGDISIDTHWGPLGTFPSTFSNQNLFTFYTPGNISVGATAARTIMGRFYAGTTFLAQNASQIIGGVSAREFDLGTQVVVPKFWQVKMPATVTALPGYGPQEQPARPSSRWGVRELHWKECSQRPIPAQPC